MYIAMNRFRIAIGSEEAFEEIWRNRESRLAETPGFQTFHLLRGATADDHTLYASHTVWADEASFQDWMRSAQFRSSHKSAGDHRGMYLEAPVFEGFAKVL